MRWLPIVALLTLACPRGRAADVRTGIDVLEENGFQELNGKRVGLITNQTGKDRGGRSTVSVLASAPGVQLQELFVPEHGFEGTQESLHISSDTLVLADGRKLPIHPTIGGTYSPTEETLSNFDALVFDIQDVGVRFYTYAATMALAMDVAAQHKMPFYVLDRPNPITGDIVEGPLLDPEIHSFIAFFPETVRHGLTVGEIAKLYRAKTHLDVDLHVIAMRGWTRGMWFDETGLPWTQPSPNMPDLDSAILYPGIGCLEGTNLSVGRGTTIPFRWIGAPWLDARRILGLLKDAQLPGVRFSEKTLTPGKNPFIYGEKKCRGIKIQVTDRDKVRPLDVFVHIACALRDAQPDKFDLQWYGPLKPEEGNARFILPTTQRRVGTDEFLRLYKSGASAEEILRFFQESAERFRADRAPYLLY